MKSETDGHVLDPESVEPVLLDKYDMHAVEEALLWYAEEKVTDDDLEEHYEVLAHHVTRKR